jgi:hypothetical protein
MRQNVPDWIQMEIGSDRDFLCTCDESAGSIKAENFLKKYQVFERLDLSVVYKDSSRNFYLLSLRATVSETLLLFACSGQP